jgi:hypothetical protein
VPVIIISGSNDGEEEDAVRRGKRNGMGDETEYPMMIRIMHISGEGGPSELEIQGCVRACDMEILKNAICQFEKRTCMKCYVNLGKARYLCPNAIMEILELRSRIEQRGDMFDIVDISAEAESTINKLGFGNALRPLYPWLYPVAPAQGPMAG